MTALANARAVLEVGQHYDHRDDAARLYDALDALVAECESERAQLGELLRALETESPGILPAALHAFLAKVEHPE